MSPVLFVFAHQDDELAYLGLMRRMVREGRDVRVVWVTDGAFTTSAEARREESLKTMRMLGIEEERLLFLGYPDGRSIHFSLPIIERLSELIEEIDPAEIYTLAFEGGHPDHDLVHFAAVIAAGRREPRIPIFETSLYNSFMTHAVRFNRLVPAEAETRHSPLSWEDALFKLRAAFNYKSQMRGPSIFNLLCVGRRRPGRGEPYREVPPRDYLQPPHEGKLFYEKFYLWRKLCVSFADFRDTVERFIRNGGNRKTTCGA